MASQGPNNPSAAALGSETLSNWSFATRVYASDDSRSYATNSTNNSWKSTKHLNITNFGFTIPSGATIDGILVEVEKYTAAYDSRDVDISLIIGGSATGSNLADTVNKWPTSETYVSYGGATNKWGLTPTAEQINGTDFGVTLQATIYKETTTLYSYIDHIRITVYYTEGSTADELTAKAIASGIPAVGKATLADVPADVTDELTAKNISTGTPAVSKSTIGQKHALTSKTIASGIPAVGKSTIGQKHALVSKAITSGVPSVAKSTLGQEHVLESKNVSSGTPAVQKPALGQAHALTAKNVTAGVPAISKATLAETEVHLYDEFITSSIMQQRAEHYRLKDEEEAIILLAIMELL